MYKHSCFFKSDSSYAQEEEEEDDADCLQDGRRQSRSVGVRYLAQASGAVEEIETDRDR